MTSSLYNYIIVLSVIELLIPFAGMTILYSIVLCKFKTRKVPGVQSVNTENLRAKRQRNASRMAIAIVPVFAICWLPISVLTLLSTFGWDLTRLSSCGSVCYWIAAQIIASAQINIVPRTLVSVLSSAENNSKIQLN